MKAKRTGYFNVYILTLKQEKGNKTVEHKYRLKKWKMYQHVNRQLACYYMYRENCDHGVIGVTMKGNPTTIEKAYAMIGCNKYDLGNIIFAIAYPIRKYTDDDDGSMIHPHDPLVSFTPTKTFNSNVEKYLKWFDWPGSENTEIDVPIQCAHEWGPANLIPKGYERVTEGEVKDGDMVWHSNSYNKNGYWVRVGSYYGVYEKAGTKIEKQGVRSEHKDGSFKDFDWYEPFVIRLKQK